MFHLHSSADHAFVITRQSKQGYSFSGPDEAVSWEAVRAVKYLVPTEDDDGGATDACPICLDSLHLSSNYKVWTFFLSLLFTAACTYTSRNEYIAGS